MADTKNVHVQAHAAAPVEGDGISYRGIIWFIVILVLTTVFCQVLVWGMFRVMAHIQRVNDEPRAPMAGPAAQPSIDENGAGGRLVTGLPPNNAPGLLVSEPVVLGEFRTQEDQELSTYGWVNKGVGTVRLPIERAKELVLQHGLPTRSANGAVAATPAKPAAKGK
jgi:hypothetical protein